jgi:hypothetical protein
MSDVLATLIAMADPAATTLILDAPITAVVVYPRQARVTRRGVVTVPTAGAPAPPEFRVTLGGLPEQIDPSSVRVSGRGAVRVLGVEVELEVRARTTDAVLAELEDRLRALRRRARELSDAADAELVLRRFLEVAARNGAAAIARDWGAPSWSGGPAEGRGTASPAGAAGEPGSGTDVPSAEAVRLAEIGDALGGQLARLARRQRAIADEQEDLGHEIGAAESAVAARRGLPRPPQTYQVTVALEPTAATGAAPDPATSGTGADPAASGLDVELEVSYLSLNAAWAARYDARLVGGTVTLTWFGMVTQSSGEDWPACDLALSTARPARSSGLPELDPWYVDVARPMPLPPPMAASPAPAMPVGAAAAGGSPSRARTKASAPAAAPVEHAVATVDTSGTAATYRPARPVPVPADGQTHRTTLAILELDADLDYLTVPKLAPEAHLRANVTNTSAHTLLTGPIAIFHGADYVGTSALAQAVPPGAEVELQLGVDDRLVVERELVSRATSRKVVGSLRRTDVGYAITLTNHTGRAARVTVRDQVPVSRHEGIAVKDFHAAPAPGETTDLGQLTWPAELAPGATKKIEFGFRLEHSRGLDLTGWTE